MPVTPFRDGAELSKSMIHATPIRLEGARESAEM
jgi:hypothetical protein